MILNIKKKIKILFIGTCNFSSFFLEKLIKKKNNIIGIITKKEKSNIKNIIKNTAIKNKIKYIYQPQNIKELKNLEKNIKKLNINLIILISYGFIIPENIINIPKYGCINIHASLLPKLRGASPIQQSILNGDKKTGITLIKINKLLDQGNIIYQKHYNIKKKDNYIKLKKKLQKIGIKGLLKIIKKIKYNIFIKNIKQDEKKTTYAKKIKKIDGKINWKKDKAINIIRKIKAYIVWPKTFFFYKNYRIILWKAKIKKKIKNNKPGRIIKFNKKELLVTTKDAILKIKKIQFSNKKKMYISEIINSKPNLFKINDFLK